MNGTRGCDWLLQGGMQDEGAVDDRGTREERIHVIMIGCALVSSDTSEVVV